ncbi:hypothetical protein ACQP1V_43130 (plasmid) [Microtetraspora malaysiensis]|uniref:recombination directionality factor n=1 Tax=Microtetraspora malaysiensis TaxID=161358 RepID=UPI003D9506F1
MPIDPSVLQRRHWQDGRIRLGIKKTSQNGKEYPSKIETFRFTSPSEEMIRGVAELYGGQVKPWKSPQGPQFEVITNAKRIPVIVPPNGLSQNMEHWESKLCLRRCTGVAMQAPFVGPCLCGADRDIKDRLCKPYTRLGVFLKEVPSLGLWRLDSKGGNAAAELPNAAEFLAHAGTYVDAWLYLAERTGSFFDEKDRKVKVATYMVPGLTIEGIGFDELMSGEVARRAELARAGGGDRKAIEAAPATDYLAMIAAATTRDDVVAIWQTVKLDPAWKGRAQEVEEAAKARVASLAKPPADAAPEPQPAPAAPKQAAPAQPAPAAAPQPPASTTDTDRLRQQIMTAWPGTITELHAAFGEATGTTMKKATVAQLESFLKVGPVLSRLGDEGAAGPIADEPRKASERAEALMQAARQQRAAAAADNEDIVEGEVLPDANDKQLRQVNILMSECGITPHTGRGSTALNDEARFEWIARFLRRRVESTKELTSSEADRVIAHLNQLKVNQARTRANLEQRIGALFDRLDQRLSGEDRLRDLSTLLGRTITGPKDLTEQELADVAGLLEDCNGKVAAWDAAIAAAADAERQSVAS